MGDKLGDHTNHYRNGTMWDLGAGEESLALAGVGEILREQLEHLRSRAI